MGDEQRLHLVISACIGAERESRSFIGCDQAKMSALPLLSRVQHFSVHVLLSVLGEAR